MRPASFMVQHTTRDNRKRLRMGQVTSEKMRHDLARFKPVGRALVLGQCHEPRSLRDVEALTTVLTTLGMRVKNCTDANVEDIRNTLHKCAEEGPSGCVMVAVVTRRDAQGRLQAKDKAYNAGELLVPFLHQPALQDTPKIFFFLLAEEEPQGIKEKQSCSLQTLKLPSAPGFLVLHASAEGQREGLEGSVYVQTLCEGLMTWPGGNLDLVTLLTDVHHRVARETLEDNPCSKVPYIMSSLQREIFISTPIREKSGIIATPLEVERYSLLRCPVSGMALIFNHYEFKSASLSRREGSHCDLARLTAACTDLSFQIRTFSDLTRREIAKTLAHYAGGAELRRCGMLLVVVMTHGEDGLLWAKDAAYPACSVWQPFLDLSDLQDKPKLFVVQACHESSRGSDRDTSSIKTRHVVTSAELSLPRAPDLVVAFSSTHGGCTQRDAQLGSCYTRALCSELKAWRESRTELQGVLNRVAVRVARQTRSEGQQTPCFVSSLRRRVVFRSSDEDERPTPVLRSAMRVRIPSMPAVTDGLTPDKPGLEADDAQGYALPGLADPEEARPDAIERKVVEVRPQMFGVLRRPKELVDLEFRAAILKNDETDFSVQLARHRHNVALLAKPLLQQLYEHDRDDLIETLLAHDLPQEEVLYFLWRTLTDPTCGAELFEKSVSAKSYLLQYHMDFRHRYSDTSEIPVGFPLLCVLQSSANESTKKQKLKTLICNGAGVDDRYIAEDEDSPIHFAVKNEMWDIVEFLLGENANVDIVIKGKTARKLIENKKPELFDRMIVNTHVETISRMFRALYNENEDEFIELLHKNKKEFTLDVNSHDGRFTLLQLAVKKIFARATKDLIENYANLCAVAGNGLQPILLSLKNPNFELLEIFAANAPNINLKFSHDCSTFLHILAKECSSERVQSFHKVDILYILVKEAIKQQIHISARDKSDKTSLEISTEHPNILFKILLDNGGFLTIEEKLLSKMQPKLLTEYFDEKCKITPYVVEMNYNFLQPVKSCIKKIDPKAAIPEMLPFLEICRSQQHQEVLLHPLVTFFLSHKWRQIAFIYIINFLLYIAFTISFSIYIYNKLENITKRESENRNATNIDFLKYIHEHLNANFFVTVILWLLMLARELFQISISFHQYRRNPENFLECLLLISSLLSFIPPLCETRFIAAIAIALTYIELTLLIGRHPYAETYITMFMRVSQKTIKLLVIFSSFIFAFAFGFYIFFRSLKNDDLFSDLWHSFVRTSVMSIGEFNIDDLRFMLSPGLSEIMFIIFLIFVPIVLINLLNALAVSDTQQIIDESNFLCCVANIRHYAKIESMLLGYSMENPEERCYGCVPNDEHKRCFSDTRRILKSFGSLFTVNLLPFPDKSYMLRIPLCHSAKKQVINNIKLNICIRIFQSVRKCFRYFYTKILLRGNEIEIAKQLSKRRALEARCDREKYEGSSAMAEAIEINRMEMQELRESLQSMSSDVKLMKQLMMAMKADMDSNI